MADEDQGKDKPSLELPSLGFGRRRGKKGAPPAEPAVTEPAEPAVTEPAEPAVTEPAEPAATQPETEPESPDAEHPDIEHPPADEQAPPPEPAEASGQPAGAAAPPPDEEATEVIDRPTPDAETTPGRPLFVDETGTAPATTAAAAPVGAAAEPAAEAGQRGPARRVPLPAISGMVAAVVTGALVGALTVGLTWLGLRGCEAVKGTSSCGGPGLFLLVAIMVAMILLGSALLRSWGVPDPGSTSFLAVGLLAVMALLFLVEVLFNWWMIIVIPVIAMLTFALSHWVTTAFIEPTN